MENLTAGLWYATHLDDRRTSQRIAPCVDVQALAKALPHGSGIDGDWYVTILRNGDVRVDGEYHNMNDGGGYCGWTTFAVFLRRAKRAKVWALKGPCEGRVQVWERKGDVTFTLRGGGRDLGDYLHECIHSALRDADVIPAQRLETVTIEQARAEGLL